MASEHPQKGPQLVQDELIVVSTVQLWYVHLLGIFVHGSEIHGLKSERLMVLFQLSVSYQSLEEAQAAGGAVKGINAKRCFSPSRTFFSNNDCFFCCSNKRLKF